MRQSYPLERKKNYYATGKVNIDCFAVGKASGFFPGLSLRAVLSAVIKTLGAIFFNVSNYQAHAHLSQLFKPARAKWSTGARVQIRIITAIEFYLLANAFYRKFKSGELKK